MTGLVLVADPPTREHLRFRLDLADGPIPHVWYWDRRGLGSVRLLTDRQFGERLGAESLGPDALALSAEDLRQCLCHSRREIKVALLDQRRWRESEIFMLQKSCTWLVFIRRSAATCFQRSVRVIHARMSKFSSWRSILRARRFRRDLSQRAQSVGRYQNHSPRVRSDGRDVSVVPRRGHCADRSAQRATFFCPTCQTKRRR